MLNKNIFFPLTYSSWDNQEIKAITKIINSGQLTYSNIVKKFESKFAHHMQMNLVFVSQLMVMVETCSLTARRNFSI